MRKWLFLLAALQIVFTPAFGQYQYHYRVEFSFPENELTEDLVSGERAEPRLQSSLPFAEWNSDSTKKRFGNWGPPCRVYPEPRGIIEKSAQWKRERVIAAGLRFVGYAYEHHHIPDWLPVSGPEGKPPRKGVDCSNFTTFIYSLALGIKPNSDVQKQSCLTSIRPPDAPRPILLQRIERPKTLAEARQILRTADLLFIKDQQDEISHVVFWLGDIGKSPDGSALILDSTGGNHRDSRGVKIPDGIHLRPVGSNSWYFANLSHALRIIPDDGK